MPKRWVENTTAQVRYVNGEALLPGEGMFVDDGPLQQPEPDLALKAAEVAGVRSLVLGVRNSLALKRFEAIQPVGFNSYDLVRRKLMDPAYDQFKILDWVQTSGGNLIRVMWPPAFDASNYTLYVFQNGVPPASRGELTDGDFRSDFLATADALFNAAASRGLQFLLCIGWSAQGVADIFGETAAVALTVGSQSHEFMGRLVRWTARRYGAHPAYAAVSFVNEPQWFELSGVGWPTAAALGAYMTSLADQHRAISSAQFVTSHLVYLTMVISAARITHDSEFARLEALTQGLDVIGIHVYTKGPSQAGFSFSGATSGLTPGTSNNLGFEGFGSLACSLRSLTDRLNKPLMWCETGVPNDVEADTARVKKDRALSELLRYSRVALLWDVADLSSPQANQIVWQIRPGTTRGDTFLAVAQDYNRGRVAELAPIIKGAGTRSLRRALQPKSFFSSTRSAGATVSCVSTGAMTSATQAVAFWVRRDAALTNFEAFIDCRGSGNLSGFVALEGAVAGTDPMFLEFRGAAGGAGNVAGLLPPMAIGEWLHLCVVRRTISGSAFLEIWINGQYWNAIAAASTYVGIPATTTLRFCGGATNGAPVSLQDVCFAPFMSPEDIWAHMRGEPVPLAQLHLRAIGDTVLDVSRGATAVTVGSGVVVTG